MQNHCAEIKIRAECRAGELLKETIPHGGGRPKNSDTMSPLSDIGISRKQSSRWQAMASIPVETRERHIEEVKSDGKTELTSVGVLRLERKLRRDKPHTRQ